LHGAAHQGDRLLRRHSQGGEHGRHPQGRRGPERRATGACQLTYLPLLKSRREGERARFDGVAVRRRETSRAQRARGRVELAGERAHGRDRAVRRHALGPAFQSLLHQQLDRQAARGGRINDPARSRNDLRRHAPGEPGRDVPLRSEPGCAEHHADRQARSAHKARAPGTATTLLRRPKPSSTAGAAGSVTQRSPSTTKAYWCCPGARARVVVQTPVVPAGARSVASRSHWLNVPAIATRCARGANSTKRTSTLSSADAAVGAAGAPLGVAFGLAKSSRKSAAAAARAPTAHGRTRSRISTSRGVEIQRHTRTALKDSLAVAGEPARRRTVSITRA